MLTRNQIKSVYSGRHGGCCGCRGKHSTGKAAITRIYNKVLALNGPNKMEPEKGYRYVSAETETRVYVLYVS